jgi:hypothetical protein
LSRLHNHTQTHHTWYDSSGRVISPTQRLLPDNTQHSQEIDFRTPAAFEPAIPGCERRQTHALDRAVTWIETASYCGIFEVLAKFSYRPPAFFATKIYRINRVYRVRECTLILTPPVTYVQYYVPGTLAKSDVVTLDISCEICYLFFFWLKRNPTVSLYTWTQIEYLHFANGVP